MLAALTGLGLSAAAGLNAYIPFLVVACLARWTSVVDLPTSWEWMESTPALVVGFVLLLVSAVWVLALWRRLRRVRGPARP